MPALVRYMLSRLFIGFMLGAVCAAAILQGEPPAFGVTLDPLEVLLFTYA